MDGVLNEVTNTVHKHESEKSDLQTVCGATFQISHDNLRMAAIGFEINRRTASKCGRCFEDAGGY